MTTRQNRGIIGLVGLTLLAWATSGWADQQTIGEKNAVLAAARAQETARPPGLGRYTPPPNEVIPEPRPDGKYVWDWESPGLRFYHYPTRGEGSIVSDEPIARDSDTEPTVADDIPEPPDPVVITEATFGLKDRYEPGEPIVAQLLLPDDEKLIDVLWEGGALGTWAARLGTVCAFPPDKAGSWVLRANYVANINGKLAIRVLTDDVTVGPDVPPKSLAELAAPDAKKLGDVYALLAKKEYFNLEAFHKMENAGLWDAKLQANAAVPVIAERLAKKFATFDAAKLTVELKAIAQELGTDGPNPPPPAPGDFAGAARQWLQAIPPAAYSKDKAIAIANAYLTIGSQGADSARNTGWTALTFDERTKSLKFDALGADGAAAWREPFFRPLADYQAKLIADRKIDVQDVKAVAALWTETGEAIEAAAY